MKKTNSSEAAYQSKQILLDFAGTEGCIGIGFPEISSPEELERELIEYDEAISDCHSMFLYAKEQGNTEEMNFWRSQEQENKTAKRLMREKYLKEVAAA